MSDSDADHETSSPPERRSLTVLPHSGKVDRLKEELAAAPSAPPAGARSSIPSSPAYDPGHAMHASPPDLAPAQRAIEAMVVEVVRSIYDPEIPVNIYDLGLIYDITVFPDNEVKVRMTLTSPACPVAGSLPGQVEQKIEAIPEVKSADIELVWDPPWDKSRMSESAALDLNLF
jgi:FeS assembly SUF system protein